MTASLKQFEVDFAQGYRRLTLPTATLEQARNLARQYKLRGYDAIQLASALALADTLGHDNVEFICADVELLTAARRQHLAVGNPQDMA